MIGAVIVVLGIIGVATSSTQQSVKTSEQSETIQVNSEDATVTTQQGGSILTHETLLEIAKSRPDEVINNTYEMVLYLEQEPSSTQAEFMSQADDNSADTLLVTCDMSTEDLGKLDGESAQKRDYKPYDLSVMFTKYHSDAGLYYEAECEIR